MKHSHLILVILLLLESGLFPTRSSAQNGYNTQSCKERLQGTWKLATVQKRSGKFTTELEGIVLKFEGDSLYWIDAIHEDTLSGRFYAWADLVEVTKSFKDDPNCNDRDDDKDNDCTYTYETRLVQQNSLSATIRSTEKGDLKTIEWNDFLLSGKQITALHPEGHTKYRLMFMRVSE